MPQNKETMVLPSLSRGVSCVAHPHVSTPVPILPLHATQDCRDVASASWGILGMEVFTIAPIRYVDSSATSNRVGINDLCRCNGVLPFLVVISIRHP